MIRKTGGYNSPHLASVILRDDTGHIVEVIARAPPGWSVGDSPLLIMEVRDLGRPEPPEQVSKAEVDALCVTRADLGQAVPATGHPDPEFATHNLGNGDQKAEEVKP